MKKIFYIVLFLLNLGVSAQNTAIFERANKFYNEGKYADAIAQYQAILATKNHSAELYFNLANAYYKLNRIAPSIYFYEKALQLSPNDTDITNNLTMARNMTIDAIDVVPEGGFTKLINNATNTLTFDGWAKLSVVLVFCFVTLFLIYYFAYETLKKRLAFISSLTALFFMGLSLLFAFHKYNLDKNDQPAIVFSKESKVKSEPNFRSNESFILHEGTKVQILDTVNNWKKIKLQDGKTGWISSEDIKAL
ncbi:MAG: tetratricopeptide repeat protein [Confluentibacter sp.]|nr:tetratricopeptide repeat protein [Confluentibacter sp.]HMR15043.1 tetratricopeptide repeat protein [Mariniflexile sp.]